VGSCGQNVGTGSKAMIPAHLVELIDRRCFPATSRIRDGYVARQRAANASCSLWLQTLASNAGRRRRWLDRASGLRRRRPGGCDMGSLGLTHLISLLLAVAIVAATCGFIASAVVRRNKRHSRRFFLLGFFCGLMAGAILRGRRRRLNTLGAVARCADVRPLRAGIRRGTGCFAARAHFE
jgi:hypothetical protein